ncbi:MAG TPA: class I SAM-dependent methyltransferase [Verrucomicrobia bacterium]|nr:class I SAM-dependent methyltransferase [Verrucomicrobiota bacterium]
MRPGGDEICPLCSAPGPFGVVADIRKRRNRMCGRCRLIFAEAAFLPSPETEKARYAKHRSGLDDAGYVAFLKQALAPALPVLSPDMRGLDYGCGHTPTLHLLLGEAGLRCENYDPFFFPEWPAGTFDFLFATEVVEHFHHPAAEWPRMLSLLKPGGLLTVMTAPWEDLESFRTWGYASDETHVAFYHQKTLEWIRAAFGFEALDSGNPRVALFRFDGRGVGI